MRVGSGLLVLSVWLAACGAPARPPARTSTTEAALPKRGEGAMPPVRASTLGGKLRAAGLDPKDLPPIESLDRRQKLAVMRTFTESLGVACVDCHAGVDWAADTRRKRVAKRMYNELTRVVALDDGEPAYCDSCHQGALFVLDRRDKSKVTDFMTDVYEGKLKRTDGREHDCATCHGDPPDLHFLTAWREHPAPDVAR
ncbi:MAG: hypothetical protein KIT84_31795 [Labilithrix sp.]|nr:hypothetical protein [Labilithrix sp.]MCW5815654.1 hypothetical protein [Labilithrix sp.]